MLYAQILEYFEYTNVMSGEHWFYRQFATVFCKKYSICGTVIDLITSKQLGLNDYSRIDVMAGHEPGCTSLKNLKYWRQFLLTGVFARYDYGPEENMRRYSQLEPPRYDLANIDIK